MTTDYLPLSNGEFNEWQASFVGYGNANLGDLGLVIFDLTPILIAQRLLSTSFTVHAAAQASAESARATKDGNRTTLESQIRALLCRLQASPDVSDPERQQLGITVTDAERTPVGPPTSRPVATVDAGERLRHTIEFSDESTPTRKAKPPGVMGAEIWVKIDGPPPVDPGELTFLAVDTRTPYMTEFDGAYGGKTAHYMLRWINSRAETGPWSQTVSATIGA